MSSLALTAFILSIIVCVPPLSLIGGVLGIVALVRLGSRPELGGKGLAIAAIPISVTSVFVIGIMAAIAIPNFLAFQARSKQMEAKSNLMALNSGERSYYEEHMAYSSDMAAVGFQPEHGNRYAYFLADSGPTDLRNGHQATPPAHPEIIEVDTTRYPKAEVFPSVARTRCPLTLTRADGGPPLALGVTGAGADSAFVALAAGNIDTDDTVDCWTIASVDRRTATGKLIPAGKPFNEQDDAKR